jgi:hypothetical protein
MLKRNGARMNLTLLKHVLSRRDWRDSMLWRDLGLTVTELRAEDVRYAFLAFGVVIAAIFAFTASLVITLLWYQRERDLPRVVGGWAYIGAVIWTLFILFRAQREFPSEQEGKTLHLEGNLLAVGTISALYFHKLFEPLVIMVYRYLRPASLLMLAGIGSFLSFSDVARLTLAGGALLFATAAAYTLVSLLAHNQFKMRAGVVTYWVLAALVFTVAGVGVPLPYLLSPHAFGATATAAAPSRLPAAAIGAAPAWVAMAGVAAVLSLLFLRRCLVAGGRDRSVRPTRSRHSRALSVLSPKTRHMCSTRNREWPARDLIRAAMDGDAKFRRDQVRSVFGVLGYVALGLVPYLGWLMVVAVFEWLLAGRLRSLISSRQLDDIRMAAMEPKDIGAGLRDLLMRDIFIALPGMVLALVLLIFAMGGWLESELPALSLVIIIGELLAIPVVAVGAFAMLKLVAQLTLFRVPRSEPGRYRIFTTAQLPLLTLLVVCYINGMISTSYDLFGFPPELAIVEFVVSSPALWLLALMVTAVAARITLRNADWTALGEWIERDSLPPQPSYSLSNPLKKTSA